MIIPYKINHENNISKINGSKLVFPFLEKPKTRNLNLIKVCSIHAHYINTLIQEKQTHLIKDVFLQKIKQQLQNSIFFKKRTSEFQSKIEKKLF